MPEPAEILDGLSTIANEGFLVSIAWHLVLVLVLTALGFGYRPSRRLGAVSLAALPVSVAIAAFAHGNPFNGTLFGALAVALAGLGLRLPRQPVERGPRWAVGLGVALFAFGFFYPHFLEGVPFYAYLFAAPTGLVPCPTLSAVIGLALLANGFSARAWSLVLASFGIFYGAYGAVRLGVHMDIALLGGAVALFVLSLRAHRSGIDGRVRSARTNQPAPSRS